MNRIRLVKSAKELKYIRAAARTAEAASVKAIRPGVREYQVAAEMHRALYMAGSTYLGTRRCSAPVRDRRGPSSRGATGWFGATSRSRWSRAAA